MRRGIARPARETPFTVVGREDKYKSKAVIDTFVYRTGDVVGAWTEGLLGRLGGGVVALTALVIPLAAAWGVLGLCLAGSRPAKPGAWRRRSRSGRRWWPGEGDWIRDRVASVTPRSWRRPNHG